MAEQNFFSKYVSQKGCNSSTIESIANRDRRKKGVKDDIALRGAIRRMLREAEK